MRARASTLQGDSQARAWPGGMIHPRPNGSLRRMLLAQRRRHKVHTPCLLASTPN
jgi:hypothetical protein